MMDLTLENLDAIEAPEMSTGATIAVAAGCFVAGGLLGFAVAAAIVT
jgi:hypothetical protein